MATDMSHLARHICSKPTTLRMKRALLAAADEVEGKGILVRLLILGRAVSTGARSFDAPEFTQLATHPSDIVRQWAAYAVNTPKKQMSVEERLAKTLVFAADRNMTVRECAWMAFRPYVAENLDLCLGLLTGPATSSDANVRRFSIEVCRPRSVWGKHIEVLKKRPQLASHVLNKVNRDSSRYVRLALGNWLNDASKTRPDWVLKICSRWSALGDQNTNAIVRRGLRTLALPHSRHRLSSLSEIRL